jgi:hypothetical protein
MQRRAILPWLLLLAAGCKHADRTTPGPGVVPVPIPNGAPGIGFDDLHFSPALRQVLAPAGRTGTLALVSGATTASVALIRGFSAGPTYDGGHDFGATSADAGNGLLFVTDRSAQQLLLVDPAARAIAASAPLAASPDYVRWTGSEVWVTEPDAEQIEVFAVVSGPGTPPRASPAALIKVAGGPESLVIDPTRKRAYTHLWSGHTVAIDLGSRAIAETWDNGCGGSRGIALDQARGYLFAGCAEGTAVVLDVSRHGAVLSRLSAGNGVDVIDYNPALAHLYLPGASSATLAILGVGVGGGLSLLGSFDTVTGAHCVAADDRAHAFVCDPNGGRLLELTDPYGASP